MLAFCQRSVLDRCESFAGLFERIGGRTDGSRSPSRSRGPAARRPRCRRPACPPRTCRSAARAGTASARPRRRTCGQRQRKHRYERAFTGFLTFTGFRSFWGVLVVVKGVEGVWNPKLVGGVTLATALVQHGLRRRCRRRRPRHPGAAGRTGTRSRRQSLSHEHWCSKNSYSRNSDSQEML